MFGRLGPQELLLILLVALLFFGPRKLPELGKSLGKGLREFKKATKEIQDAVNLDATESTRSKPTGTPAGKAELASSPAPSGAEVNRAGQTAGDEAHGKQEAAAPAVSQK